MKINQMLAKINKLEKILMGSIFMLLTVLVCTQVFIRWVGMQSFSWLEEFSQYLFICVAFCGASIAVTEDSHMKIRLLETMLPPKINRGIEMVANLACAATGIWVMSVAYKNTLVLYRVKSLSAVMAWPVWIIYAIITLCMAGLSIRFVLRALWPIPKQAQS